jgi:hypothetical protein
VNKRRRGRPAPKSIFPRHVPPLPVLEAPGAALRRLIAEKRAARHAQLAKAERRRVREFKLAFAEGARFGRDWLDPDESWWRSRAQARLDPPAVPGRGAARWQHERKLIAGTWHDEAYAERWRRRSRQLREAFEQGHWAGACGYDLADAWQHSPIRASLYPGPPTPLRLRILAAWRHAALGDCPIDRSRDVGGPC